MTDSRQTRSPVAMGFLLVALGAALWGTDGLFRRTLALEMPATLVVFSEHLILVAIMLPLVIAGFRGLGSFNRRDWVSLILVGAGASAVATYLFTLSFRYGDPNTTLLLQKLQPLFAVVGARLFLGERLLRRYPLFFALAVAGAYLMAFDDPLHVRAEQVRPALLSIGAAALWGMGTVLGRHLTVKVPVNQLTALRFAFGLPAAGILVFLDLAPDGLPAVATSQIRALVILALVPGLLALTIYYRGLRKTPASAATLAELSFPLTAVVVNYFAFDATLNATRWLGLAVLLATMIWMAYAARKGAENLGIQVPVPVPA